MSAIQPFRDKMQRAGVSEPAIRAFERAYAQLATGETAMLPEDAISPVESLPNADALPGAAPEEIGGLLAQCAVLKLNGGLGTSMGLDRAKSLLEVRPGVTFLDLIARQVAHFRETTGANVRFLLMNSFSTSADTRAFLARHPGLGDADEIELLQNKTPKIDAATLAPVEWPANPEFEWCPPGHGDLYPVLAGSGALDRLLAAGVRTLFVSNSDNLGATLDPKLLKWFAGSGAPFAMEVTARTPSDRKGGHLAQRESGLLLRESAQCPDADLGSFQDIGRHRFFNTNNLWLRLDRLSEALAAAGGFLPLPVIQNRKTVDSRDKKSTAVYQLETAMGAAIECFPDATAIVVPRTRFAPVKTTGDLLTLRSDAYVIGEDGGVQLAPERGGIPPRVDLDDHYKLVDQLEAALVDGAPSLKNCDSLKISGPVALSSAVIFEGDVVVTNPPSARATIPPGVYSGSVAPG
ncbi:MAG: UTP--glucose-1-phosphate uridylyltransferase [Terrimicrobiaceae bacterium]|nr:UTP--glucose-1-phosphate uridylyltransferase [Terrimicrobiaceae bacterium]